MITYHIPKNEQLMDELYVALSSDESGEGIVSMHTEMGNFPIVFGHKNIFDKVLPLLYQISKDTGKTINVFRFKKSDLLETINYKNYKD